jgi:hypothetical protein
MIDIAGKICSLKDKSGFKGKGNFGEQKFACLITVIRTAFATGPKVAGSNPAEDDGF